MQVTVLENEGLNFHAKVLIPSGDIDNEIQKELESLATKVSIAGFRPGAVPVSVVRRKRGAAVRDDVVSRSIDRSIASVIKDYQLNVVGNPVVEDLKNEGGQDLEFVVKFELFPSMVLPDFSAVEIDKPVLVIDSKDVDAQIDVLAKMSKDYIKPSTIGAQSGDQVVIDAVGYIDGKAFQGGKLTDHKLVIGSGVFIQGFEDQLIGSKAGDEVEVNVTFPESYHVQDLVGKDARFVVHVKSVHVPQPVEVNDEFAKRFKANDLDELRAHVMRSMKSDAEAAVNAVMKINLFNQLEGMLTFDVPKYLLSQEYDVVKSEIYADRNSELLRDKSEEEVEAYCNKLALRRVRIGLALAEYVKIKNLQLDSDDFKKIIMAQARMFPGQEGEVFSFYNKNPKAIEHLRGPALEEKAVEHLFNNELKIISKEYNRQEFTKLLTEEDSKMPF